MTLWEIIIVVTMFGVIGLGTYNIWSLIRKMKHNPNNVFDLLIGVFVWLLAIGILSWQIIVRLFM